MSESIIKRRSKCKVSKDNSCFGYKKHGNEYKTCTQCRSKNPSQSIDQIIEISNCLIPYYYQYKTLRDKSKPFLRVE